MREFWFFIFVLTCISCHKRPPEKPNAFEFDAPEKLAEIRSNRLEEASGLVASISNEGLFWTHNDSGNPAEVFLIDEKVDIKLTCKLKNIKNRDWEDIAVGPGPDHDKNYLYVGDIGDNLAQFPTKIIYRFEEPSVASDSVKEIIVQNFDTIVFRLEDKVKDTETLMIHPKTKKIYVVSKREDPVVLYELPFPTDSKDTLVAKAIARIPLSQIVAGDFSPNGDEIVLKNYQNIYYWKIQDVEDLAETFLQAPKILPYKEEPQGESIAFSRDGNSFYTISEKIRGEKSYLSIYRRK